MTAGRLSRASALALLAKLDLRLLEGFCNPVSNHCAGILNQCFHG